MTREVVTLAEDDSPTDARRCTTRGRLRHPPGVRGSRPTGLVTHRDPLAPSLSMFAHASDRQALSQIRVRELMHDAFTVRPTMRVCDAARIMLDSQYGCLPVADVEGKLLGIVTEAGVLPQAVRMFEASQA
jgi:CBS domain-containing membrane protein